MSHLGKKYNHSHDSTSVVTFQQKHFGLEIFAQQKYLPIEIRLDVCHTTCALYMYVYMCRTATF
jgi:hypothetical protein